MLLLSALDSCPWGMPMAMAALMKSALPISTVPTSSARPTGNTTNIYGDVEDVVGKWFNRTGKRNEIFLATKFGFVNLMEPTNIRSDLENVFESCESSLKRLQT